MIGFLSGKVVFSEEGQLIISTQGGVGYQLFFHQNLPKGDPVSLFVSSIYKENSVALFGFLSLEDKRIFELLIQVKGVGPKLAYNMLSQLGRYKVFEAISLEMSSVFSSVSGIGKKTASQIILDLKDKIQKISISKTSGSVDLNSEPPVIEALEALKQLGYSEEIILPRLQGFLSQEKNYRAEQMVELFLREQ